ncbi:CRY [Mytilus coruscus]|uniref:Cryptochrome-1 n=1 Tax=Mytilus coruscus TaxID=42192 RepID=A0A6J8A3U8_MYTCO|nr:CRY [Mytilus coruscus]
MSKGDAKELNMPPQDFNKRYGNVSVHWFRHGLRLHDNPALLEALKNCTEFYPIFIFDGEVAGTKHVAFNRMRFLIESLEDLDRNLRKFGGRLYVFHGQPVDILTNLFKEWGVTKLTFEQDPEAVWKQRDDAVKELCEKKEIECVERVSHTLYEPMKIIEKNDGMPPLTYSLFNLVASALGDPPRPVSYPVFHNIDLPVYPDHEKKFGIPKPQTVGVFPDCKEQNNRINEWKGGETKALDLLEKRLAIEKKAYEDGYVLPNQYSPDLLGEPMSMSAHLRFGCLSVRRFHWTIHDLFEKVKPKESKPDALTCQLIWREYFYVMSANNINYDKMEGNPICLNIPWYRNDEILKKWEMGQTGYPWIDAIMNQLRHEGWIHHVGRHAVACFLTRGDLWISWVDGLKIFLKYLIDADWSVSAGNWMWVSSSAFEKVLQCPKCFCPVGYGRRMDRTGEYIRRYLPVLKDMPLRYLFEPWKAPLAVQQKAYCIVGKDYPHPIVNHKEASNECASAMNKVIESFKGKEVPHCAPSDDLEVRRFVCLPDFVSTGGKCTANQLCPGIENL